ncbi:hypothetical protein [Kineosporia succinea]|uniref:Flp pilus-assembly TadE/G-like protein n=1 Tax=Kineosporia succinea TaxID=84632 RepID=A0ABT9P6W8_9ACTN|nr:hypothetical protein [Kineosporia succinea]MDP9828182.1 hypothetical protein [Kineosporia succinea]
MTPRISLRPQGVTAALITFVAIVLTLLSVATIVSKHTAGQHRSATATAERDARGPESARASARNHPVSTASPVSHRVAVQTPDRRVTATAAGQGAEIHFPGGSPDVPAALDGRAWYLPTDLIDLPVDASAQVIATTVSVSHRGRAPPSSGFHT